MRELKGYLGTYRNKKAAAALAALEKNMNLKRVGPWGLLVLVAILFGALGAKSVMIGYIWGLFNSQPIAGSLVHGWNEACGEWGLSSWMPFGFLGVVIMSFVFSDRARRQSA